MHLPQDSGVVAHFSIVGFGGEHHLHSLHASSAAGASE
jgi:hypothetical protein